MAERPDSGPDLPSIDVPTLVVTSDHDELIPMAVSAPMADAIPGAELAVIAGAGHLSNVERPEEFSALLSRTSAMRRPGPAAVRGRPEQAEAPVDWRA